MEIGGTVHATTLRLTRESRTRPASFLHFDPLQPTPHAAAKALKSEASHHHRTHILLRQLKTQLTSQSPLIHGHARLLQPPMFSFWNLIMGEQRHAVFLYFATHDNLFNLDSVAQIPRMAVPPHDRCRLRPCLLLDAARHVRSHPPAPPDAVSQHPAPQLCG
ncbi:hypothetical protein K461DRAFT_52955 [Myriangium duriaei CBS 260.36]|uniref:Uncharacterized protein n=1 Tax=Myriangium duriaei CBS 260.36 TaxID=1168546 RepID=A0A9P4IUM2_9PEZI|nr:hypothetical protein K461DRAFT_52955 [Myriangium duriaei CBS 260.36]